MRSLTFVITDHELHNFCGQFHYWNKLFEALLKLMIVSVGTFDQRRSNFATVFVKMMLKYD